MSVSAGLTLQFEEPTYEPVRAIRGLIAAGWTLDDHGCILILPLGDDDAALRRHEDRGGEFLFESSGLVMFSATVDRRVRVGLVNGHPKTMQKTESTLSQHRPSPEEIELRRDVLLTAQLALLGEISASVRAVTVGWSASMLQLRAIFDREIAEDDRESIECVGTELIAGFPNHQIDVEVVRCDHPERLDPFLLGAWVYIRKETS